MRRPSRTVSFVCAAALGVVACGGSTEMAEVVASATVTSSGSGGSGSGGAGPCLSNGDGSIARSEVVFAAGLHATFRIADDVTVDLAGKAQPDGSRAWDVAGAYANDADVTVVTKEPAGQWFAADFPTATYTAPLAKHPTLGVLVGIFEAKADSLALLGVASPAEAVNATKVTYAPPATILAFPLADDASWKTSATVTGKAAGIAAVYAETYDSTVDAHGSLKTPYGTFDVLRVKTTMTRTVGVVPTVTRSFAFVAPCFGTVASVTSQPNEPQEEFSNAAQLRRLAP